MSGLENVEVGPALAEYLNDIPLLERSGHVRPWIERLTAAQGDSPVLCTEIDLLFEPSLRLDALAILHACSTYQRLVVLWPGEFVRSGVSYAEPDHAHFRTWNALPPQTQRISVF